MKNNTITVMRNDQEKLGEMVCLAPKIETFILHLTRLQTKRHTGKKLRGNEII